MALNAKEFLEKKQYKANQDADHWEGLIDEALSHNYNPSEGRAVINLDIPSLCRTELQERYRKAGWKIVFNDCQREGSWISLTPAPFQVGG